MGKRGPPPLPTAVKKLRGTLEKSRELGRNEMAPPPGVPVRPDWLDDEAAAEWDRVVPELESLGMLAVIDRARLADYCTAQSLAVEATKTYQREGLLLEINGQLQRHPAVKIAQEARAQAARLAAEFGLSPSSRTRVKAPEKASEIDETEAFLFAPKVIDGGKTG